MISDTRTAIREYFDHAASNYRDRTSKGFMGWLRQRELALTHEMIPMGEGRTALDAGCGPGHYCRFLKDRGFQVSAVDISAEMVRTVRGLGFPAHVMDIEYSDPPVELPAPFDFVLCAGVLDYVDNPRGFLASLRRLAKSDAEAVIVAPLDGTLGFFYRRFMVRRGIPIRLYTPESLATDLRAVGFDPTSIRVAKPICLAAHVRAVS